MRKMILNEWVEIAEKAMCRASFPPCTSEETARGIGSSILASFCNLLSENGFAIVKQEEEKS